MLTAFNYYEPEEESRIQRGMKENPYFEQELAIAEQFTKSHAAPQQSRTLCPVCGDRKLLRFYEKWGAVYLRCPNCYSVMADIRPDAAAEYEELEDMRKIRLSEQYQEAGTESRQQKWEELLDWLRYRTFRYCGRNTGFSVLDYGTRWRGLEKLLRESDLCGSYELRDSILTKTQEKSVGPGNPADIILALDYIQKKSEPAQFFREAHDNLKIDGLLVLGTKAGSGFDILALRGNNRNVFPYEHILMPSKEGIEILLDQTGFELLEYTTPGTFDWNYVKANREGLAADDYFLRYFLETASPSAEAEFQRFIQKSGLSSYAQVIARRKD